MIYAKKANIKQNNDKYIFNLNDGFKITLLANEIEKLRI